MDITVNSDDKRGKENNFISGLEPREVLGSLARSLAATSRGAGGRLQFSEDGCCPGLYEVLLEKN